MAEEERQHPRGSATPRRRRWVIRGLVALAVVAGAFFGWGALEASKYEARVKQLRDAGALPPFSRWSAESVPSDRNGFGALKEAVDAFHAIRDKHTATAPRVEGWSAWGNDKRLLRERPAAQQAAERAFVPKLEGVLATLDEALGHALIVSDQEPPETADGMFEVMYALELLRRFGGVDPDDETLYIDRMLRLIDRWQTTPGSVAPRATIVRNRAVAHLKRFLAAARPKMILRSEWDAILEAEERRLMESLTWRDAYERACAVWLLDHWVRSEDPMESFDDGPPLTDARTWIATMPVRASVRPPGRHWWNRPLLHAFAREAAEAMPDTPPSRLSLEDMRRVILDGQPEPDIAHTRVMETILVLRLARAAMHVARVLEATSPEPVDLDALERACTDDGLLDPCSETPLAFTLTEDGAVVVTAPESSVLTRVLARETHDADHLTWRVPR